MEIAVIFSILVGAATIFTGVYNAMLNRKRDDREAERHSWEARREQELRDAKAKEAEASKEEELRQLSSREKEFNERIQDLTEESRGIRERIRAVKERHSRKREMLVEEQSAKEGANRGVAYMPGSSNDHLKIKKSNRDVLADFDERNELELVPLEEQELANRREQQKIRRDLSTLRGRRAELNPKEPPAPQPTPLSASTPEPPSAST